MFYKIIFVAGLCVSLLTTTGCQGPGTVSSPEATKAKAVETTEPGTVETKPAGTVEPGGGEIEYKASDGIISLGDKKLTMQQIQWRQPNPDDRQIAVLANAWLKTELMCAEAERRGITELPRAQFFAALMRKRAFEEELRRQVQEAAKITDEDVLNYYEKNKEKESSLMTRGYLTFSHVRTGTLKEANNVLEKVKAGENINQLARKVSIHRDSKRGGQVKKSPHMMVKRRFGSRFFDAVRAAMEGELIGPIVIDANNYEVVRKEGEIKSAPLPFEEVKDRIKSQLQRRTKTKAYQLLFDSLKEQAADKIVKSPRLIEAEKAQKNLKPVRLGNTRTEK